MDIYDMCCTDLWTNLDKVFTIEHINRLSVFSVFVVQWTVGHHQLIDYSVTVVYRIYAVFDGWNHWKRDVWANKLGQATIGAA
jgi:hypothetical protein